MSTTKEKQEKTEPFNKISFSPPFSAKELSANMQSLQVAFSTVFNVCL